MLSIELKKQKFKNNEFKVKKGLLHPEYSYFTFESEENEFRDKYWNISAGDVVFDIGSSYGSYSLSACSMGAIVHSFEPELLVLFDFITNVAINNWHETCFIHNYGLWDSDTQINFRETAPHWPAHTISSLYTVKTLDNVVRDCNINKIDWIKIDVEGAEEKVIIGGLDSIKKFKPKMIIECHIFIDPNLHNKIKSLLPDYNFIEELRDPCILLYCTPKEVSG